MINKIRWIFKTIYLRRLVKRGLKLGSNFQFEKGSNIDAAFPWLITIGDNVTFASWVYVVAHDGASQKHVGYSKVGNIVIGNNVFIGTKSTILPNVRIGDNSIIGANSVVTRDVPPNTIAAGNPAKVILSLDDYKEKIIQKMSSDNTFGVDYTLHGKISSEKKKYMSTVLGDKGGFIV